MKPKAAPVARRANLLEMTRGAAVISRTGEALLETSAVRLIDGDDMTAWVLPPGDPHHSAVISLPTSSVDLVGVVTSGTKDLSPTALLLELSADAGKSFHEVARFPVKPTRDAQTFPVVRQPANAIRVTVLGGNGFYTQISTLYAAGEPQPVTARAVLDGCYTIGGRSARFVASGTGFTGVVDPIRNVSNALPLSLEGGTDVDGLQRFAWIRGLEYGVGAADVSTDGNHVSALVWHEEAIAATMFQVPDWMGDRSSCSQRGRREDVFRLYLEREHFVPLYGLAYDRNGRLDEASCAPTLQRVTEFLTANGAIPVRFVAHELRLASPQQNRSVTDTELATLREALRRRGASLSNVQFVSMGADKPRREATTALTRAMYSRVDLEVAHP